MKIAPRHLRIAVAAAVLALAVAVFAGALDPFPQMGPATLRAFSMGAGVSIGIALAFTVLTLLFGRVYCACLCPMGILQDVIAWAARRKGAVDTNRKALRYGILAASAGLLAAGWAAHARLLEPFTLFGRIVSGFALPVYSKAAQAVGFGKFSGGFTATAAGMAVGAAILAVFIILAVRRQRVFCTSVCPVGTLLGLFSRVGLFRLEIKRNSCIHCGKCARVCPAGCVDPIADKLDNERCVRCMNCVSSCPKRIVNWVPAWRRAQPAGAPPAADAVASSAVPPRRKFFAGLLAAVAGGYAAGRFFRPNGIIPLHVKPGIYPPGAGSQQRFAARCTNCLACVNSCGGKVLMPPDSSHTTVHLDYNKGMCEFNCNACSRVCPNGAIMPISLEDKKRTRIGMAVLHSTRCIAIVDGIHCGACAEHCPTGALRMVQHEGAPCPVPVLTEALCIGCGNCSTPCPVRPVRAMTVSPVSIQVKAADPVEHFRKKGESVAPPVDTGDWLI